MISASFITPDEVRTRFARAMSSMYRAEVPQYGKLMDLVEDVNAETLMAATDLNTQLLRTGDLERIGLERHGAIRLGTAAELSMVRRLFAVMGMVPVGYYDLSVAGVPVHSTGFRPVDERSLAINPFRIFTSLLRLELIQDSALREEAKAILSRRRIFTDGALAMISQFEREGGLTYAEAEIFVREAVQTFRWHGEATVDSETYNRLNQVHRLIADVVSFKGPHINHLTPRTLDIDAVQAAMPKHGITAKAVIEGPPKRNCPILLRQTSFKALEEPIWFKGASDGPPGNHTARFGEIEQRGIALTRKGRALYDDLLASVRNDKAGGDASNDYCTRLAKAFKVFPDDYGEIRAHALGFFHYALSVAGGQTASAGSEVMPIEMLVSAGHVKAYPIIYEDFLPVSAAGIFQSNLGGQEQRSYDSNANKDAFVEALGAPVLDEFQVYAAAEARSIEAVRSALSYNRHNSVI